MADNPSSRGVFNDKICHSIRVQSRSRVPRIDSVLDVPAGEAGNFAFNIPDKLPYYSDGLNWIPFGKGSAPGCGNVFVVEEGTSNPSNYATINLALSAAIAAGHDTSDPAIICICPSSVFPPYNEDFTVRPGFDLTGPDGLGTATLVTGRAVFDNTGFPPGVFDNVNSVTGISFFHTDGLGPSVTITGPEDGEVRFMFSAIGGVSPAFPAIDINGPMIDTTLNNCPGLFNFGGPVISHTGGNLIITNCVRTFGSGDFLTVPINTIFLLRLFILHLRQNFV